MKEEASNNTHLVVHCSREHSSERAAAEQPPPRHLVRVNPVLVPDVLEHLDDKNTVISFCFSESIGFGHLPLGKTHHQFVLHEANLAFPGMGPTEIQRTSQRI